MSYAKLDGFLAVYKAFWPLTTHLGQKDSKKGSTKKKKGGKKKRIMNNFSAAFHGLTEKFAIRQFLSSHGTD